MSGGIRTRNLTIRFGGLIAVNAVDFSLDPGEIVGIIGPNGAGKTTLINLLAGIYRPTEGAVYLDDRDITATPAHDRAAMGIGRTFQLIHPLEDLTVLENVMTGFLFARRKRLSEARDLAADLCRSLGLDRVERETSRLNILEIKKMEIAKALAIDPVVLFLDEVMAGLTSTETIDIIDMIRAIAVERNLGIGVVEHVMGVIRELTQRVVVLDGGAVIATGPYAEVSRDERVKSAYLGGGA